MVLPGSEYLGQARELLLSTIKVDINAWENDSVKEKFINDIDVIILAENISLLESKGLQKLNEKLFSKVRNIEDFITEHSFAAELLRYHGWKVNISYEPQAGKNTDFVILFEDYKDKKINIQIKNSSPTERENRRDKIYAHIKKELKKVMLPRFYSFSMHENFNESNISNFIDFIKQNLGSPDNVELPFETNGVVLSKVSFSKPNNRDIDCMLPGVRGGMNFINVSGEERSHFYNSLTRAASSFDSESDNNNINLIVSEANNKDNIDIGQAIFGDEYFIYSTGESNPNMRRHQNGFFHSVESKNVTAVITLKKKESFRKISTYSKNVFFKHIHEDAGEAILDLLKLDRIIGSNMLITHRY